MAVSAPPPPSLVCVVKVLIPVEEGAVTAAPPPAYVRLKTLAVPPLHVKFIVIVQGPVPLMPATLAVAVPTGAIVTKPGEELDAFWGAVQPAGTTTVACEPEVKSPFAPLRVRNWKAKLF